MASVIDHVASAAQAVTSRAALPIGEAAPPCPPLAASLTLPDELVEILTPPLESLGLPLQLYGKGKGERVGWMASTTFYYVPQNGERVALVSVPGRLVEESCRENLAALGFLFLGLAKRVHVFVDTDRLPSLVRLQAFWAEKRVPEVAFEPRTTLEEMEKEPTEERAYLLEHLLKLERPVETPEPTQPAASPAPPAPEPDRSPEPAGEKEPDSDSREAPAPVPPQAGKVASGDLKILRELLAREAYAASASDEYLRTLIREADFPVAIGSAAFEKIGKNPDRSASNLLTWANGHGHHPTRPQVTLLGALLQPLLPRLDLEGRQTVAAIIDHYGLYLDADLQLNLVAGLQVPRAAADRRVEEFGPDFERPAEELTYESFLRKEPKLWDVGQLRRAMARTSAICRVEVGRTELRGTGFLIGRQNLVLTNYHNFENPDGKDLPLGEMTENASTAVLRFGAYTAATGDELDGRTFGVDGVEPVLAASPKNRLDYVLLKLEDSVLEAADLTTVPYSVAQPRKRDPLNVLQHPEGHAMKIAFSDNAVTAVDDEDGSLLYVSNTTEGSSGSPCFNDKWEVVALHHAQRAQSIGMIRRGLLMSHIVPEIEKYLS